MPDKNGHLGREQLGPRPAFHTFGRQASTVVVEGSRLSTNVAVVLCAMDVMESLTLEEDDTLVQSDTTTVAYKLFC